MSDSLTEVCNRSSPCAGLLNFCCHRERMSDALACITRTIAGCARCLTFTPCVEARPRIRCSVEEQRAFHRAIFRPLTDISELQKLLAKMPEHVDHLTMSNC